MLVNMNEGITMVIINGNIVDIVNDWKLQLTIENLLEQIAGIFDT